MDLAAHQRMLAALIKQTRSEQPLETPYLQEVAHSPQLALIRKIILLWKTYELGQICVLTTGYLRLKGTYETIIDDFIRCTTLSPYIERLGEAFLAYLCDDADPLLQAIAQTEAALLSVARGDIKTEVIDWPCNPYPILAAILQGNVRGLASPQHPYRIHVSSELPSRFSVTRVCEAEFSEN